MHRKTLSLLPVLAVACGALVLPASSASAATAKSLPVTSFDQVVADTAHGHLFFSEGSMMSGSPTAGGSAILITDLDGNPVTSITGLSGVRGLALSPDGSVLYAAVTGADEIVAINTSTLKLSATYSTSGYAPYFLAFQDGILWIGYQVGLQNFTGDVGYIDPSATSPVFVPNALPALPGTWVFAPYISGDPDSRSTSSTTGTLVVSSPGETPTPVNSYEISGTTVTSSDVASLEGAHNARYNLDVLPGGSQFVMDGSLYDTANIAAGPEVTYPTPFEADSAAAIAPNGTLAIGYGTNSWNDAGISIFPAGSTTASPAGGYVHLGGMSSYIAGLAWSSDGSELYAVITAIDSTGNATKYTLQPVNPADPGPVTPYPTTLTTSASAVGYKKTVNLTVSLAVTNDDSMHTVDIYETPAGGKQTLIKTVSLSSAYGYEFPTGQLTTRTSFTATVSGDSAYAAAKTAPVTVGVDASVQEAISGYYGTATYTNLYRLYHHTGTLRVNTTVFPGKPGECVKFEFQRNNGKAWVPLTTTGCATLNSSSKFVIYRPMSEYSVGGKYRIRVDYIPSSKDTANLAADSGWLYYMDEK